VRPAQTGAAIDGNAVLLRIQEYRPRLPELRERWEGDQLLRGLVTEAIVAARWTRTEELAEAIGIVGRFVIHCLDLGVAPSLDQIFRFVHAESYLDRLAGAARYVHRGRLVKVGKALGLEVEQVLTANSAEPIWTHAEPYSESELDAFLNFAPTQATELMRRTALSMLMLCHGAGAHGSEVPWVQRRDLVIEDDLVAVRYGEPRMRIVPVLERYHDTARWFHETLDDDDFLTGRRPRDGYKSTQLAWTLDGSRSGRSPLPVLRARRLRNTWLRTMVQRPIPLVDLMAATGTSRSQLVMELVKSLPTGDPLRFHTIFQKDT
jgi:hypothetical protein